MSLLSVQVLGPFQARRSQELLTGFPTDKVRALLVYLMLSPDHPHRREALAGLLWPEFPERSARTNLRNALASLRQVICDGAASPPFLHCTRQTIQFNGQSEYWLDVNAFEDLLTLQPTTSVLLEQAIGLAKGPFLEGFTLADSAPFDEWLLLRREHFGRRVIEALDRLVMIQEEQGAFECALAYARRRVELEPWQEEGQRQLMRLLVRNGRRSEALALYEALRQELQTELGVNPAPETTRLLEQIQQSELKRSPAALGPETLFTLPGFLEQDKDAREPPTFVAMERELAHLEAHLEDALSGHGHVAFVSGGPGRGKTTLLAEFSRKAMGINPDLLVASGSCNAFSGIGDPYLPFREVMAMLTGDLESRWLSGSLSTDQARRLWSAFPLAIQSLLLHGPHVTGPLISGQTLLSRAALWCTADSTAHKNAAWLHQLRRRIEAQQSGLAVSEQSHLFQQVTNLLRNLAKARPLLLILDDLQWADTASISLLFHLGRRLEGTRILILGAYRAEEVAQSLPEGFTWKSSPKYSEQVEQHPLQKVLNEFKNNHRDIWLDLDLSGESEQRHFVDALLDTEPNHLGENFREELVRRAGGHPLFTVELVRAMQARGDLIRDGKGFWKEGPLLDWDALPVRVQGAIEVRIARVEPELREILTVASVEGEILTVQVLAQLHGIEEDVLLRRLSQDLGKRHKLVVEQGEMRIGTRHLIRFKFSHALIQNYLYQQLSRAERRRLHGKIAAALESCYGEKADAFAVQLAQHNSKAGDDGRALHYFTLAAQHAQTIYAHEEACKHYTRAIEAANRVLADAQSRIRLYLGRGQAFQALGDFASALGDYQEAQQLAEPMDEPVYKSLSWRVLTNLGRLWSSRDYKQAYDHFCAALELAHSLGDPNAIAQSLNWMGNWYLNQENPQTASDYHQEALQTFEHDGNQRDLARTLDLLGIANLLRGDISASVGYYDRAISLFREMDDQTNLVSSLTGRGHAGCSTYSLLSNCSSMLLVTPRRDFAEAERLSQQIGSPAGEAWVCWSLGTLEIVQGRFGQALQVIQRGLEIANQIRHREWIVGSRCTLGLLYLQLLAPERALKQLEPTLILAEELGSPVWVRGAAGNLAAAYNLLGNHNQAQMLLESVLRADTPMDTMNIRYCWTRRAELALCQDDPNLALDIIERLIATAPGVVPGGVISFLWKLKGEVLAALGQPEEALPLLEAAIENGLLTGQQFLQWQLHASMGQLYRTVGRESEAEIQFYNALNHIQELGDTMPDGALKNTFLRRAQQRLLVTPEGMSCC